MKKTLKTIITSLSLIFVLCFSVFAVGCSNKNKVANKNIVTNVVDQGSEKEHEDVSDQNQEETNTINIQELNGIYKHTSSSYSFDDKYFKDLEELVTFFKTTDANGVFYAVKNLGFDEFLYNISNDKTYNKPKAILINNGHVINLCYNENDTYLYTDGDNNFALTQNGNSINTSKADVLFEANESTISIYYQFTYVNDSNETISTPLYIKTTLEKQEHSTNLFTGKTFVYQANSLKLNISPVSTVDKDYYLNLIVDIYKNAADDENSPIINHFPGLNEVPNKNNILKTINTIASVFTFNVLDDLSIKAEVYNIFHTFVNIDGSYENYGIIGKISSRVITESSDIINFELQLADDATLTFSFIAM